jgi:hypothetical protein
MVIGAGLEDTGNDHTGGIERLGGSVSERTCQRLEVRGQRSEVSSQTSEVRPFA